MTATGKECRVPQVNAWGLSVLLHQSTDRLSFLWHVANVHIYGAITKLPGIFAYRARKSHSEHVLSFAPWRLVFFQRRVADRPAFIKIILYIWSNVNARRYISRMQFGSVALAIVGDNAGLLIRCLQRRSVRKLYLNPCI